MQPVGYLDVTHIPLNLLHHRVCRDFVQEVLTPINYTNHKDLEVPGLPSSERIELLHDSSFRPKIASVPVTFPSYTSRRTAVLVFMYFSYIYHRNCDIPLPCTGKPVMMRYFRWMDEGEWKKAWNWFKDVGCKHQQQLWQHFHARVEAHRADSIADEKRLEAQEIARKASYAVLPIPFDFQV
jgi:hypothetical protein